MRTEPATPVGPTNADPLRKRFIAVDRVVAEKHAAKKAQSEYRALIDSLKPYRSPNALIEAARRLMAEAQSPDDIQKAQKLFAELQSEPVKLAAERANGLAIKALHKLRANLKPLVAAALAALPDLEIEIEVAEAALSDGFGYSREVRFRSGAA